MSTRYGRSPGGYAWALLEPLGGILLLSIGFSLFIHRPPLGSSFMLFYATGVTPFMLYQSVSNNVARSIQFSRSLLSFPAVSWLDAIIARWILNSLTGVLVAIITLISILFVSGEPIAIRPLPFAGAMFLAIIFGFGVGVINCFLIGLFPVWAMIWSILTRPLFLLSGVLMIYEKLSESAQSILWYNPIIHILAMMRMAIYPTYQAEDLAIPYVIGVSLALSLLGLILMRRWHRLILEK